MDSIPAGLANGVGVVAVVLLFGYGLWRSLANGALATRREVELMRASYERQLEDAHHDRDEWRAAHRISETARQVAADQVDELLEHARTTDQFIRSLGRPSQEAH
jgi:hypothetical protein